jgi:acetyltransferase-like isoleucine patch superfamily enzyme
MPERDEYKLKSMMKTGGGKSALQVYRDLVYGRQNLLVVIYSELLFLLVGNLPGALGLFLRSVFYPVLFKKAGRKVVFGRNVTIRHAHKIELGDRVVLDDNSVIDAKGDSNRGIILGDNVYIGRNTIVYCKNGNITMGEKVNISSNCQIFSSNELVFKPRSVVGAFSYFLSGGEYDPNDSTPFADQSGMCTKGPLSIGENVWVAAHVSVLDAATIGDDCVIGAGAVVNKPIPDGSIAVGVPAKVVGEKPRTTA